jgi:hypothetical protein
MKMHTNIILEKILNSDKMIINEKINIY